MMCASSFTLNTYQVKPGERHTSIWRPLWDSINQLYYVRRLTRFYFFLPLTFWGLQGTLLSSSLPISQDILPVGARPRLQADTLGRRVRCGRLSLREGSNSEAAHILHPIQAQAINDDAERLLRPPAPGRPSAGSSECRTVTTM